MSSNCSCIDPTLIHSIPSLAISFHCYTVLPHLHQVNFVTQYSVTWIELILLQIFPHVHGTYIVTQHSRLASSSHLYTVFPRLHQVILLHSIPSLVSSLHCFTVCPHLHRAYIVTQYSLACIKVTLLHSIPTLVSSLHCYTVFTHLHRVYIVYTVFPHLHRPYIVTGYSLTCIYLTLLHSIPLLAWNLHCYTVFQTCIELTLVHSIASLALSLHRYTHQVYIVTQYYDTCIELTLLHNIPSLASSLHCCTVYTQYLTVPWNRLNSFSFRANFKVKKSAKGGIQHMTVRHFIAQSSFHSLAMTKILLSETSNIKPPPPTTTSSSLLSSSSSVSLRNTFWLQVCFLSH